MTNSDEEASETDPSKSVISGTSGRHEHNNEVLEDLFPIHSKELLLVVTYEKLFFLDNEMREKPILEIKLENILYVMGKSDVLKIGFQLNANLLTKD